MSRFSKRIFDAGWPFLPWAYVDGSKKPLVGGFHGEDRKRATIADVKGWLKRWPDANPGVVMPDNVIGFDVDGSSHGEGIDGFEAIKAFEAEFGPLPETGHIFHGRDAEGGPSPYGTYLYRIPDDMLDVYTRGSVVGNLAKVTGHDGVDIIAPWLRYQGAPGAVHASGDTYEFTPSPTPGLPWLPKVSDLPVLSKRQVEGLLKRRSSPRVKSKPASAKPITAAKPIVSAGDKPLSGKELLAKVERLAGLGHNERLTHKGKQIGWQENNGFYLLACDVIRAAKDRQKAKRLFLKAADAAIDSGYDVEREWDNAEAAIEDEEAEVTHGGDIEPVPFPINVDPYRFADVLVERNFLNDEGVLLLRWHEQETMFWMWDDRRGHYVGLTEGEMRSITKRILYGVAETTPDGVVRAVTPKKPNVDAMIEGFKTSTLVSSHGGGLLKTGRLGIPFRNGWLDVNTGTLTPTSPDRDVRWVVNADYDPKAECPMWEAFLDSIGFTEGSQERRLLRQWFGYLLSGDTRQHKALMMVGGKRAGKGTTQRIAEALFGGVEPTWSGAGATTLDRFQPDKTFGLANLIGKALATVDDARWGKNDSGRNATLLSFISGGAIPAEKKHKDPFSIRPTARLMIASNETPRFFDASDALASRFLMLHYPKSFYGVEDYDLEEKLKTELPGIARWALDGLADLNEVGRFSETDKGLAMQRQVARDSSPVRSFVEDLCVIDPEAMIEKSDLYEAYCEYRDLPENNQTLSDFWRDFASSFPGEEFREARPNVRGRRVLVIRGLKLKASVL